MALVVVPILIIYSLIVAFGARAQTSSASWQFPDAKDDGLIINNIDVVMLQWTSNFEEAWIEMWCQKGTGDEQIGSDVIQGSMFQVNTSGTYPYVLAKDDPDQQAFPVACHAQLVDKPNGNGPDSPVGVTFVSVSAATGAKTFAFIPSTTEAAAVTTSSSSSSSSSSSKVSSISSTSSTFTSTPAITGDPTSNTSPALPSNTTNAIEPQIKHGLSDGAKAGIAITIVVAVFAIAGIAVWIAWRRRKRNSQAVPELDNRADLGPYGAPHYGRHELEDEVRRKFELDASGIDRPELEGPPVVHEMPATSPRLKPLIPEQKVGFI